MKLQQLSNTRLTAFTHQENLFLFIFGDKEKDFTPSTHTNRFEIPERGLALKTIETCYKANGDLHGFKLTDKKNKTLYEWRFDSCQQITSFSLKDGERIVNRVGVVNKERSKIIYYDFVVSSF